MVIPDDDFEQVIPAITLLTLYKYLFCVQVLTQCNEVFHTWDDEFDRFKGLLFKIRKKTQEHILVDDVPHEHKNLQERVLSLQK